MLTDSVILVIRRLMHMHNCLPMDNHLSVAMTNSTYLGVNSQLWVIVYLHVCSSHTKSGISNSATYCVDQQFQVTGMKPISPIDMCGSPWSCMSVCATVLYGLGSRCCANSTMMIFLSCFYNKHYGNLKNKYIVFT